MEYDSKSSPMAIASASVSKTQKEGYLPKNVKSSYANTLKAIFSDEFNESSFFPEFQTESYFRKQTNSLYSTEQNSYLSRNPEFDRTKFETLEKNVSFTDIFGDKTELNNRLSLSHVEFGDECDECFFPSDVGKKMLLKDEEEYARRFLSKNDATCSSRDSWIVCTSKSLPDISFLDDQYHPGSKERRYSIGEYIKRLSEPIGSLSKEVFCQKVYFGCNASTPIPARSASPNFNDNFQDLRETPACRPLYECIPNLNIQYKSKNMTSPKTGPLFQMFLYSAKKKDDFKDYKYYIDAVNYEKIQRLEEASKRKNLSNTIKNLSFTSNVEANSEEKTSGFLPQFDISTFKVDSYFKNSQEDAVVEQWTVQPQELILDISSKGCRLLLKSFSETDLKFKTTFDSKFTNVCPISGVLPSKDKIGLRILVSRFIKTKFKGDTEAVVIITCGKKEKAIRVKICKQQKTGKFPMKDRSYKCF